MRLAVIVPTLNEAATLERCLPPLLASGAEVIVSDGGSTDATVEVAQRLGARVVSGAPGRGPQLNRGAAATEADILFFLHADTRLPEEGAADIVATIIAAIAAGAAGGGFEVRFDSSRPLLRLAARLVNLRSRWLRVPLGDQGQFASRAAFTALEGFRPWPILEDLDFIRRLRRQGHLVLLRPPLVTSARRFLAGGVLRTVANNWLIWGLFLLGVPPQRLARLYRHVR